MAIRKSTAGKMRVRAGGATKAVDNRVQKPIKKR